MLAAIASAALIVGGSLASGQAILALCGHRSTLLAGPVGFAALLTAAGIVAGWGGRGTAIAITLIVIVVVAAVVLATVGSASRGRARARTERGSRLVAPAAAALLAALAAAVPFIAAGHVGILGVGLVNDDMANHLLLSDWISERFRPEPVLIDQGYPLGPHALVAGLASLLNATSIDVFAGLILAIPALTALVAYGALENVRPVARVLASAGVALPYLAAAYLAQEAFKEPIIALFVLAFALLLTRMRDWRSAIPLGLLAAGVTYVYSFPGLAWLAGTAIVYGSLELWRARRGGRGSARTRDARSRAAAIAVGIGLLTLVLLSLPEAGRLLDFVDFRALHPDRANEGGLGNLPGQLSPLEALGIWPTSEFRLSATASSVPAVVFYAGGLFALVCLALGLPRWIRRNGTAVVSALLAAAILYLAARALGTVYTSAKALAIAAPLVMLVTLGGLLAERRRALTLVALVFGLAAAGSSFLILRQAPVAPDAHASELAQIRPLVEGEKLLFLGRDNFVLYELRGSKPFTHVRNFYDPYFVEPNFAIKDVGSKFDFDSVTAETLARFPYVLTTRAAYASGPPPGYRAVERTPSYELWRRHGSPVGRRPAERDAQPGRFGGCPARAPGMIADFRRTPVVAAASEWSDATLEDGSPASVELDLPRGRWNLSVQYDATRPLTLGDPAAGYSATLPGNLDYRGTAPFWPAGTIEADGRDPIRIGASVERPPLVGRLLGAHSVAHLGAIAATRVGDPRLHHGPPPGCRVYVDWTMP